MTSAVVQQANRSASHDDIRMAAIAGGGVTFSVIAMVARLAGALPAGPATVIVVVGASIALKVAFSYTAKSASAPNRARIMNLISAVGLAISGVTMVAVLPHLTKTAGIGVFAANLMAMLWTLTILAVVTGSARTLGWRAFVGAGLTGFLAVPALLELLERPVVTALGATSVLAVGLIVPVTEEMVKLLPVALALRAALRRTTARPAALDLMLLGAWTGAGYELAENAMNGKGLFSLSTIPGISLLIPSATTTLNIVRMSHGGHMIATALIALGIGLVAFYRKRIPRPRLVLLVACLVPLGEHICNNTLATTGHTNALTDFGLTLSLDGLLSSILLIAGIAYALYLERRAVGIVGVKLAEFRPEAWLDIPVTEGQRRARLLAHAQDTRSLVVSPT